MAIEKRVVDLRKRFKELEQLLRTRELDVKLADHEIAKIGRSMADPERSEEQLESLKRAMEYAQRHRAHILSVMQARNTYVIRLQELYQHVRQLHSHMMMMDTPAPVESDELVSEIDALVAAVDAVDVVRKEVLSSLETRNQARAAARQPH